jgi:hypothetical protein
MSEVDLQSLPPLLTADVQRTDAKGMPTDALSDWEQYQQNWFTTQVVSLDTKLTTVASETDANTASITEETTARTTADEAEAQARVTLEAKVDNNQAGITTELTTLANQDIAFAQDLETLTATVDGNQASVTTQLEALATADTALSGRQDTFETTLDGQTATIADLTTSVNGIAVQKVVTATLNGSTGGYEFAGVRNADGTGATFSMSFNANNFSLTDPGYAGGTPTNVFSYSSGVFTFNVPVMVNGGQIAPGSISQWGNAAWNSGESAVGLGATSNTDQHFAGCVVAFSYDGTPCCVDLVANVNYRVAGAAGFPVDFSIFVHLDGTIIDTIASRVSQVNDSGVANSNRTYRLFYNNSGDLASGNHQFYFSTSFHGSVSGSAAYIENGTTLSFILLKKTGV